MQEPRARSASVTDEALTVDLIDGRTIAVPLVWYPRSWHRTPEERSRFEIFGDGTYTHWRDLDEGLIVAGLLAARRSGESPESLRGWLESRQRKRRESARGPSDKRMPPVRQRRAGG